MTHKCIKYRLTAEGTIPTFLCFHEGSVGGAYAVEDLSTPSPRDWVLIGISENDEIGDAEHVATKADLQTYLTAVGADWTTPGETPDADPVSFDPAAAATWVWDRLDALNA